MFQSYTKFQDDQNYFEVSGNFFEVNEDLNR